MVEVKTVFEKARGCGFRKPGGLYLRSDGPLTPCGQLPVDLIRCPCCDQGIKPARGISFVTGEILGLDGVCEGGSPERCDACPIGNITPQEKMGLMWIGSRHYSKDSFIKEAAEMGISRRLPGLPRQFELGMRVILAHREGRMKEDGTWVAQAFSVFTPQRIEYVLAKGDTTEKLQRLVDKGIDIVQVIPVTDNAELPFEYPVNPIFHQLKIH